MAESGESDCHVTGGIYKLLGGKDCIPGIAIVDIALRGEHGEKKKLVQISSKEGEVWDRK